MRRTAGLVVAVGLTGGLLAAGCGSSSPGLSAQASQQLRAQVQAVGAAARAGDPAQAAADLDRLRAEVGQLEAAHQLSASRSAAILTAAAEVQGQLAAIPTTTSSTSTTTTTTTLPAPVRPGPPPPGPDHGGGAKHGHGD